MKRFPAALWLIALGGCAGLFAPRTIPDQGMTSDYHRTHVGAVVFAGAKIAKGEEHPETFKSDFALGDPIYGRIYMARSWENEANVRHESAFNLFLRVKIDGNDVGSITPLLETEWTTYMFSFTRGDDNIKWNELDWFLKQIAPRLQPGKHKVEVALVGGHGKAENYKPAPPPLAVGTFTLDVPQNVDNAIAKIMQREADRVAKEKADEAAFVAKMRAQGLVAVSITTVGSCRPKMLDPGNGQPVGDDAGWYKPGTIVQACDPMTFACHNVYQLTTSGDQTVTVRCD